MIAQPSHQVSLAFLFPNRDVMLVGLSEKEMKTILRKVEDDEWEKKAVKTAVDRCPIKTTSESSYILSRQRVRENSNSTYAK